MDVSSGGSAVRFLRLSPALPRSRQPVTAATTLEPCARPVVMPEVVLGDLFPPEEAGFALTGPCVAATMPAPPVFVVELMLFVLTRHGTLLC